MGLFEEQAVDQNLLYPLSRQRMRKQSALIVFLCLVDGAQHLAHRLTARCLKVHLSMELERPDSCLPKRFSASRRN